jgi:hypothetical protein
MMTLETVKFKSQQIRLVVKIASNFVQIKIEQKTRLNNYSIRKRVIHCFKTRILKARQWIEKGGKKGGCV